MTDAVLQSAPPAAAPPPEPAPPPGQPWRQVAGAAAGMALFGFALRTASSRAVPGLGHLAWSGALPAAVLLAWAVCLPALYVFWASKQPGFGFGACARAAAEALGATGAALASAAPVLWFFAVTAPHSRIVSPLGLAFTALALLAGGALFGQRVRALGGALGRPGQWLFVALVAVSFAQFALATGIRWLPVGG